MILSPFSIFKGESSTPSGIMPIPEVLIKIPSPFPLSTTLVSPATIFTPAF